MTEREYVLVSDLQRVRIALDLLRHVACGTDSTGLDEDEVRGVLGKLSRWGDRLYDQVDENSREFDLAYVEPVDAGTEEDDECGDDEEGGQA